MSVEKAMEQRITAAIEARLPFLIAEGVRRELDQREQSRGRTAKSMADRIKAGDVPTVTPKMKAEGPVDDLGHDF